MENEKLNFIGWNIYFLFFETPFLAAIGING